jgi:hypothetical protein
MKNLTIVNSTSAYEAEKNRRQRNGIKLNAMSCEDLKKEFASLIAEKYGTSVSFAIMALHKATK